MKKFVGSLVMLLVAGGAAAPYVSGYYTQKYYREALEALVSRSPGYKLEIDSYNMGWLHSEAHFKLTLPRSSHQHLCADSKSPLVLEFVDQIQHGPILFNQEDSKVQLAFAKINGHFEGIDENISKTCADLVGFKWPISPSELYAYQGVVDFNGDFHTKVTGKPFQYQKDKVNYKWKGLSGEIHLENNQSLLSYQMALPGMDIQYENNQSTIHIDKIALNGHHQKMKDQEVWLGDINMTVSGVNLQEGRWTMNLNDMSFGHKVTLTDNLLSASANYIINSVEVDKIKVGPINMMFSFHHIEPALVEMFQEVKGNVEQSTEGYVEALKKYQSKNKEDALSIINRQLKQSPEAKIDQIVVQFPKGELSVNALASLGGPDSKIESLDNYMMIMLMAKASGEFAVDEAVFDYLLEQQSQETANALPKEFWAQQQTTQEKWVTDNTTKLKDQALKTGAFVKEGKKIFSRFKYENNGLTINGKSIKDIMSTYAELNKPKPAPAPAAQPLVPGAPVVPGAPEAQPAMPAASAPGTALEPAGVAAPGATTAPSTDVPVAPNPPSVTPEPVAQPTANNPNDPAKPSEPVPASGLSNPPAATTLAPAPETK